MDALATQLAFAQRFGHAPRFSAGARPSGILMALEEPTRFFISFNFSIENQVSCSMNDRGDELVWLIDSVRDSEAVTNLASLRTSKSLERDHLIQLMEAFFASSISSKIDRGFECFVEVHKGFDDDWARDVHVMVSVVRCLRDAFNVEIGDETLAFLSCEVLQRARGSDVAGFTQAFLGEVCFPTAMAAQLGSDYAIVAKTNDARVERYRCPSQEMLETIVGLARQTMSLLAVKRKAARVVSSPAFLRWSEFKMTDVLNCIQVNDVHQLDLLVSEWQAEASRVWRSAGSESRDFR